MGGNASEASCARALSAFTPGSSRVRRLAPDMKRRSFLHMMAASAAACTLPRGSASPDASTRPRPSASQLQWQRDELALFLPFGVHTFTDREWGDGNESPSIFNPTALDARQWSRAAKAAGARALILTA